MPSDSFFAHYMPRFMHLWWLLIIIWISHDILRAVSYFLYHYYFINLQIACKGMLTNSAKQWLPFLAMNLENFKKYLQVCFTKTLKNINWNLNSTGVHHPWDPILGGWRKLASPHRLDVPGRLLCGLPRSPGQGCLHVGLSVSASLTYLWWWIKQNEEFEAPSFW